MNWPFDPLRIFGYSVVMIDPPWHFALRSKAGEKKSPQSHYSTMSMDDIASLPVGDLVCAGGVLWCWCTWPLIDQQADIIKRWGFKIKTGGVWAKRTPSGKLRWGLGYIFRSVCEPFLLCTIGDDHRFGDGRTINLIETVADGVLDGVAREHSRKPDEAYAIVEKLTPNSFRADVFSRQKRLGWDVWGMEVGKFSSEQKETESA
jgi:N6-adenosine-specific RNA methylase IME4